MFGRSGIKTLSQKCPHAKCSLWVWVVDKFTQQKLVGAKYAVTGPAKPQGQIPKNGMAVLENLPAGTYRVTGSATALAGYENSTAEAVEVVLAAGETGTAKIEVEVNEAIALVLLDHEDLGVNSEAYDFKAPNGAALAGALAATGVKRLQKIRKAGECELRFPQLDDEVWDFESTAAGTALPPSKGPAITPAAETLPNPYTVAAGDCIHSLAYRAGVPFQRLWDHNGALKNQRKDPAVLAPGDQVSIPAKRTAKVAKKKTGATHKFRRKETSRTYRLQILMGDQVRENVDCEVAVDGKDVPVKKSGQWVEFPIRPDAKEAVVKLSVIHGVKESPQAGEKLEYKIKLGHLRPADTPGGQEDRLRDLGYYLAWPEGATPALAEVLRLFQLCQKLDPADGVASEATLKKLKELTGDPA